RLCRRGAAGRADSTGRVKKDRARRADEPADPGSHRPRGRRVDHVRRPLIRPMSITETKYSIVVPFFNEEGSVRALYTKIVEVMDALGETYEMVFVNDGSRDRTGAILAEICENDERVVAVMLRRNFGQTPALKAGFDFARGDVIIS